MSTEIQKNYPDGRFMNARLFHSQKNFTEFGDLINEIWERYFTGYTGIVRLMGEKYELLSALIFNLYTAFKKGKPLILSLDKNHYSNYLKQHPSSCYTHANIDFILSVLKKTGLISWTNGYYDPISNIRKRTRIMHGEDLSLIFRQLWELSDAKDRAFINKKINTIKKSPFVVLDRFEVKRPERNLIFKDGDYIYNKKTREYERFLDEYNDSISGHSILLPYETTESVCSLSEGGLGEWSSVPEWAEEEYIAEEVLDTNPSLLSHYASSPFIYAACSSSLHRVFNRGSLKCGGRFYGGQYQGFPSSQRSRILIDSSPVVEYDFSSLHPTMLLNSIGKDIPDCDIYDIYGNELLRKAVKLIVNISINAKSMVGATSAFNKKLNNLNFDNPKHLKLFEIQNIMLERGLTPNTLLRDFLKTHPDFEQFLFSDRGIHLMRDDSDIASAILGHFHSLDIPCLCVHDSFIVQKQYEDEISSVMKDAYYSKMKFHCKVSK